MRLRYRQGTSAATREPLRSSYERKCYARNICLELRHEYGDSLYPVCPVLKQVVNTGKLYSMCDIPNTNSPTLDSVTRILAVADSLIRLEPNLWTVVFCAHRENFLKDWVDPIRADLSALPQLLEKDYPETSKQCKELIAELNLAEWRYFMHGQSFVYMLPDRAETELRYFLSIKSLPRHFVFDNWATFLQWRERQTGLSKLFDEAEICRLTRHYPAEAIKVMRTLHNKLSPLANKILPEQVLETNRRNAELKEVLSEGLNKLVANKPAETQQKASLGTCWKIWNRVKEIPRWISGLIAAVLVAVIAAVVVEIFTDLGWIQRIKRLFTR